MRIACTIILIVVQKSYALARTSLCCFNKSNVKYSACTHLLETTAMTKHIKIRKRCPIPLLVLMNLLHLQIFSNVCIIQ